MPVAPTMAIKGDRGGADNIVIARFVARSIKQERVPEVRASLASNECSRAEIEHRNEACPLS